MQQLTKIFENTGEHNKDLSTSRQNRDWQDLRKIYTCIKERNPFQIEGQLINISNGMHAHATVNVELARNGWNKNLK